MEYKDLLELLFSNFPKLFDMYKMDDSLWELPHCVFEIIVFPYIMKLCQHDNEDELIKMGEFLEQMSFSEDINVIEVLNVSLLESLALERNENTIILKKYLGRKTREELEYWEKKYS